MRLSEKLSSLINMCGTLKYKGHNKQSMQIKQKRQWVCIKNICINISTFLDLKNPVLNFPNFLSSHVVEHCFHIYHFLIQMCITRSYLMNGLKSPICNSSNFIESPVCKMSSWSRVIVDNGRKILRSKSLSISGTLSIAVLCQRG